ncbi:MAG: hypothetical protein WB615_04125 [Candidatus Tumulicola sp.]
MRSPRDRFGRSVASDARVAPSEPSTVTRVDRRLRAAAYGLLALACAVSVWPLLASQTIPAFQQDWAWPLSRPLAWQWLRAFVGLWDPRSMGQGNALPWQTYAVAVQVAVVMVFGAATGLAAWIGALEFLAACSCIAMLDAFGVRSWPARLAAALFYALGPVAFTRIAAGHLAYLLAYALLPLAIALGRRTIEHPRIMNAVALGVVIGISGCQVQFLVIAWIAVLPLTLLVPREAGWWRRLLAAAGIALAVQLQALLPLAFGSTPALYAAQPALLSFEYNNSSPFASAPVMLGYFTRYYETHALAGAFDGLYVLLAASIVIAIVAAWRSGLYALALVVAGTVLTAGLYGPFSSVLAWAFEHAAYFAVFRDLHYFAALTAAGTALALGLALQRLPSFFSLPCLALVGWIVAPTLAGVELRELLVSPAYVADVLADMQTAAANGAGRVLWLPAEEPIGPRGAANQGRDFTAYGPAGNPSVSDDYQNPQLAYALATLRSGAPDWNAFAAMNVRYLVFRNYLRSDRMLNFGTGFPMAFRGLTDAGVGQLLQRSRGLVHLRQTALSTVYELPKHAGSSYVARGNAGAMLYSSLHAGEVALASPGSGVVRLPTSPESADPRLGWVAGTLGWRYAAWLPDSVYPFVWTLSAVPLALDLPAGACVLAGALPRGARVSQPTGAQIVRGTWSRYAIAAPAATLYPNRGDVSAVVDRRCDRRAESPVTLRSVYVFAGGYDAGWRVLDGGRLVPPMLANGWMMAWDAADASKRRVYLPAIFQLIGLLTASVVLAAALLLARRADVRR